MPRRIRIGTEHASRLDAPRAFPWLTINSPATTSRANVNRECQSRSCISIGSRDGWAGSMDNNPDAAPQLSDQARDAAPPVLSSARLPATMPDLNLPSSGRLRPPRCLANVWFCAFLAISGEYWCMGGPADKNHAKWSRGRGFGLGLGRPSLGAKMFGKCLVIGHRKALNCRGLHGLAGLATRSNKPLRARLAGA